MKIELKQIYMENYKCFPDKNVDFFPNTQITGRNQEGKSTIQDAYFDVLTGRMADGTQPDKIRPHDENGIDLNSDDIIRELQIEIDGKSLCLRKKTAQKWKGRIGEAEGTLAGNETTYEIDGFPKRAKEFYEFLEQIAKSEILMMCSNPASFLAMMRKSTAEARKAIENISGFNECQFVLDNPQYGVVSTILNGHSVEDVLKKLRRQLSEQKKKADAKNTEIRYERARQSADGTIEVSALELAKKEWKDKLSDIDLKISDLEDTSKAYDSISEELLRLKKERDAFVEQCQAAIIGQTETLQTEIIELNSKKSKAESDLNTQSILANRLAIEITQREENIAQYRKDYKKYSEQEFDETNLRRIEADQFDESSFICPTCGQIYPEIMCEELKERFISEKAKRLAEEYELRDTFYEIKAKRIKEITQKGNDEKSALDLAKSNLEQATAESKRLSVEVERISEEIQNSQETLTQILLEKDVSKNPEYQEISAEITKQEERISALNGNAEKKNGLREQRDKYVAEIVAIDVQIQKAVDIEEEKASRIETLTKELREISQAVADVEKQIYAIGEFSRAKNKALAEKVNPFFRHFKFVFLEYTIDGNPVETCRIVANGTDYMNGLNGGDKKLCEIDLCRGFQAMNGLCLPIWVDEANTIDPDRIPQDLEQQLILISRNDGDLRIEMRGEENGQSKD